MPTETKICQNCKQSFVIEDDDFAFYKKIDVPPPTYCLECRYQRKLMFRNERILCKRSCDLCGKEIISMYRADASFPVYCRTCWWSDKWDAREYGRDYDASKGFFEQFLALRNTVPHEALQSNNSTKSDYANFIRNAKEAYLSFIIAESENMSFSRYTIQAKDCVSCTYITSCNHCVRIDRSAFCSECSDGTVLENCRDVHFTSYSTGCSSCYGCINLRNQQYHIFNRPYGKEEYEQRLAELRALPFEEQQKQVRNFLLTQPHRAYVHLGSKNVTGDDIYYSVNCHRCFMTNFVRDSAYLVEVTSWSRSNETVQDLYDCTIVADIQLCYELIGGSKSYNCRFGIINDNCLDAQYSMFCYGDENIFGCVGLRNKKRCVLNKEYGRDEYELLIAKIRQHMMAANDYGGFFPVSISPFAYNETMAPDHFPLSKQEAVGKGYQWRDPEPRKYQIGGDVIACANAGTAGGCTTAFKFIPFELELYKKLKLPLPTLCPNCRYTASLKQHNPFKLWHRNCMCNYPIYKNTDKHSHHPEGKCPNEFETSYAPDRPEIVYCEQCYNAEIA